MGQPSVPTLFKQLVLISVRHSATVLSERRQVAICSCSAAIFSRTSLDGAACAPADAGGGSADHTLALARAKAIARDARRRPNAVFTVAPPSGSRAAVSPAHTSAAIRTFHTLCVFAATTELQDTGWGSDRRGIGYTLESRPARQWRGKSPGHPRAAHIPG